MGKLVFCYWMPRGLGAPAVNMLEYGGLDYEHKLILPTEREKWFAEKFSLGLDFPNLPYIVDGDVSLTESWAIYKYIAKKVDLMPPPGDEYDRQRDMLEGVIEDIRGLFSSSCYKDDFYSLVDKILETQTKKFEMMEKYLNSRKFLVGNKLSYLDFALYETLDHHRHFYTDVFAKYPSITAYMNRFESVDQINTYFKSDRYNQFPITGPMAMWGGKSYNDKK